MNELRAPIALGVKTGKRMNLGSMTLTELAAISQEDILQIIFELSKSQADLEKQNEDLRLKCKESDLARARYKGINDSAPIGCITLSNQGIILEANLAASSFLGKDQQSVINQPLIPFILPDDKDLFYTKFQQLMKTEEIQEFELRLAKNSNTVFWAQLADSIKRKDNAEPEHLVILKDISLRKQAENKLKESEINLKNFFNASLDFQWVLDKQGNILVVNQTIINKLGYQESELIGHHIADIHPPKLRSEALSIFTDMITGLQRKYQIPIQTKDGSEIQVDTIIYTGLWDSKPALFGVSRDITALRISEEKFAKTFHASPNIIGLSDLVTHEYIEVNQAFCNILGYTPEEILHKKVSDILRLDDDFRYEAIQSLSQQGCFRNIETVIFNKHGRPIDVLVSGDIINIQGREYSLVTAVDITEKIQAEQRNRETEKLYRSLLSFSPQGLLVLDLDRNIINISDITIDIFGVGGIEELVGKDFLSLIPSTKKKIIESLLDRTLSGHQVVNEEVILEKSNKTLFLAEISTALVLRDSGEPHVIIISINDISQKKIKEQQLLNSERMANLGVMASGMAHEIYQPLNSIQLGLENLLNKIHKTQKVDEEYLRTKVEKVTEDIVFIASIIDHVRFFEDDQDHYIQTTFCVNECISKAISMVDQQFANQGIQLTVSLDKENLVILGNSHSFEQVILNLLSNAKDSYKKDSASLNSHEKKVSVRTSHDKTNIYVEVKDNGCGFDQIVASRLSQPFFTTKEPGKGMGLGLPISMRIIQELKGTIEIESKPGVGSVFKIALPNSHE